MSIDKLIMIQIAQPSDSSRTFSAVDSSGLLALLAAFITFRTET